MASVFCRKSARIGLSFGGKTPPLKPLQPRACGGLLGFADARWLKPDDRTIFMPSTHKKVVVRKMDRDSINGHVAPANFIREGKLELLNTSGNVVAIDLRDIKAVYFVREFGDSESLSRKTFTSRPRTEGLWVRLKFRDNEVLEGMMPNDLSLTTAEGFLINPPDLRSNTQRIFVPRSALESLTVLAVIGATHRRRRQAVSDARQVQLFGE
jgi:hypothetical protein